MVVAELSIIGLFWFIHHFRTTSADSTLGRRMNPLAEFRPVPHWIASTLGLRLANASLARGCTPLAGITVVCVRFHETLEPILRDREQ